MSGAHAHQHGHGHAHGCAADHHRGGYTERQQADLDLVLAFNHRLTVAVEECVDITGTIAELDPDPLRYMWVDEGDGLIPAQLAKAAAVLDVAPRLVGQARGAAAVVAGSRNAARPSVAARGDRTLVGWLEWQEGRGDRLRRRAEPTGGDDDGGRGPRGPLPPDRGHHRRRHALAAVRPVGRRPGRGLGLPVRRGLLERTGGGEQHRRTLVQPGGRSPTPTGACTCAWQGRVGDRFGIFSRRWSDGSLGGAGVGERGRGVQRLGPDPRPPTVTAWPTPGPSTRTGSYASRCARSAPTAWRGWSAGSPVAATTRCTPAWPRPPTAALWCAFDVITMQGHGGSGPTRLPPAARDGGRADDQDGMREPGDSVPPELLPEVSAEIRVVCVGDDGTGGAARRARPRARRRAVGAAAAAGHRGRWPGGRLPRPPPAAADDLLLGGGRPGARRRTAGGRRSRSAAPTPRSRRCRWPQASAGSWSPPSPTDGWTAPCTGPRGSAAASARTSPTTTAP